MTGPDLKEKPCRVLSIPQMCKIVHPSLTEEHGTRNNPYILDPSDNEDMDLKGKDSDGTPSPTHGKDPGASSRGMSPVGAASGSNPMELVPPKVQTRCDLRRKRKSLVRRSNLVCGSAERLSASFGMSLSR